MAVVAVIITAPLGAILTNTLGVIWLNDDSDWNPKANTGNIAPGQSLALNKFTSEELERIDKGENLNKVGRKSVVTMGTSTGGLTKFTKKGGGGLNDIESSANDMGDLDESPSHKKTSHIAVLPGSSI